MAELVRAKDPVSRHEFTTSREHAEASGLVILKGKDTVDAFGHPLPAKTHMPKGGKPAAHDNEPGSDEDTDETPGDTAGADTTDAAEEIR